MRESAGANPNERFFQRVFKDITLTELQVAKRDSIMEAFRQRQPVFSAASMTPASLDSLRTLMRTQGAARLSALRGILSPDQQRVFDVNTETTQPDRKPPYH